MKRNSHFSALPAKYIFSEIQDRERRYLEENPSSSLIRLSVGDTTQPITQSIVEQFIQTATDLGTEQGYVGYGPERGYDATSKAIAAIYYRGKVQPDDIFISDGAGCDIGRLQILFGPDAAIAVQDPSYPAYHDTSILIRGKESLISLPCNSENGFFPDLSEALSADVLFFCSPCNPTGHAFSHTEMQKLVQFARDHQKIIVMDAAYGLFSTKCRSIYEIKGADEVAIELGSFSKCAGFSGVRLGWSVVPKKLPHNLHADWSRVVATFFNGPSYISQQGAIAALQNMPALERYVGNYMENTSILRKAISGKTVEIHGGIDAPYLWLRFPGKSSWQAFDELLTSCGITSMPGVGFGAHGEGYIRLSCLGRRDNILEAAQRLNAYF